MATHFHWSPEQVLDIPRTRRARLIEKHAELEERKAVKQREAMTAARRKKR